MSRQVTKRYLSLFLAGIIMSLTSSFQISRPICYSHSGEERRIYMIGGSGSDNNGEVDFDTFNPLKPFQKAPGNPTKRATYTDTHISMRKVIMQELTGKLLSAVESKDELQSILDEYREFLLEPLEDQEAVLEPGSIYSPGMSRGDRYRAYRLSMDERVASCKNPQVRLVLEGMRHFVLSFE